MVSIYLDECGYTGADLINVDQPIFVIASHNINERECLEIKETFFGRIQASELKHSILGKRPNQQKMVLEFLSYLVEKGYSVKTSIVHKQYAVICKMVEMIETVMYDDGIDLYDQGGNLGLANLLFYCLPVFGGKVLFEDLLYRFQTMMRVKDEKSYDLFFEPLFKKYEPKELDDLITFFRSIHLKFGYGFLDYIKDHNHLDISLTSALTIMARWRSEISDEISLIHDASTNMSKQKDIWDAIVDPNLPPIVTGYDRRQLKFPIGVSSTVFEQSEKWVGLQLADIIAGATTRSLQWIINGKSSEDHYARQVTDYVNKFVEHGIWPEMAATPSELETEGENAANPIDFILDVTKRL